MQCPVPMDVCCKLGIFLALSVTTIAQERVIVTPSLRRTTVLERSSQQFDCYITTTDKTPDLVWLKLDSQSGSYIPVTSVEKITDNNDNTSIIHRFLVFPSFTSEDAGTYKCSLRKPGSADEWEIKLTLQKICAPGKYGIHCMSNCSKFCKTTGPGKDESPCHYTNGTCRNGCLSGYTGANCSSGGHSESDKGLTDGAIAGIIVAAVIIIIIIISSIGICIAYCRNENFRNRLCKTFSCKDRNQQPMVNDDNCTNEQHTGDGQHGGSPVNISGKKKRYGVPKHPNEDIPFVDRKATGGQCDAHRQPQSDLDDLPNEHSADLNSDIDRVSGREQNENAHNLGPPGRDGQGGGEQPDVTDSEEPSSDISACIQPGTSTASNPGTAFKSSSSTTGPSHSDNSMNGAAVQDCVAAAALSEEDLWRERNELKQKLEEIEQSQARLQDKAEKDQLAHERDMAQKDRQIAEKDKQLAERDTDIAKLEARWQVTQLKTEKHLKELQEIRDGYLRQQKENNINLSKKLDDRLIKLIKEATKDAKELEDNNDILLQMVINNAHDLAEEFSNSNQRTEEEERDHCDQQAQAQRELGQQIEEISQENTVIDRKIRRLTQSPTPEDGAKAEASFGTSTSAEQYTNGNIDEIPLGILNFVENRINPETILPLFRQYDPAVLSNEDIEAINLISAQDNRIRTAHELLDRLSKHPSWLQCLIRVLRDTRVQQNDVADTLEGFLKHH